MVTPDHRRQAKVVQLRIVYGLSPFGLSQNLASIPARQNNSLPTISKLTKAFRAFIDKTLEEARRDLKVKLFTDASVPSRTSTAKIPTSADSPSAPP